MHRFIKRCPSPQETKCPATASPNSAADYARQFANDTASTILGIADAFTFGGYTKMTEAIGLGTVDHNTAYNAGLYGSAALGGATAIRGAVSGGLRFELGNFKQGGEWFFPEGTRGPHFHWGVGSGLQNHHLPWQANNWVRNLNSLANRGKADSDLANVRNIVGGAAVATSPALTQQNCQ